MDNFYQIELPISKKKIYVRDWTVKEDNDLALKIQTLDKTAKTHVIEQNKVIMQFVKEHLKNPEIFDTLNILDFRYIQIALHNGSKGNIIEYRYSCRNENHDGKRCSAYDQPQDGRLDIVNDIKFPENIKEIQVDATDELSVTMIPLPLVKEMEFIEKLITEDNYTTKMFKFNCLVASIKTVIERGNIKELSFEEKVEYFENLKPKELKPIAESYNKLNVDLEVTKKNRCAVCKNETPISIGGFNFFI